MVILRRFFGSIIFIVGAWLVFLEVLIAMGELHALRKHLLSIVVSLFVGIGMIYGGVKLVKSKRFLGILLYVLAAYFFYIFLCPLPQKDDWPDLLVFLLVPFSLIVGGTFMMIQRATGK